MGPGLVSFVIHASERIVRGGGHTLAVRAPPTGLCDTCRHQQVVRTTRGSRFSLCRRSKTDDAYPRYPRVPVRECRGYERDADAGGR